MPFITADKIHNGRQWFPDGTVLEVSDSGAIHAIVNGPCPDAIFYDGVLTPGFINVHCHLELSHMKGVVPEHTGLVPFLKQIPRHRNDFTDEQKRMARQQGYNELLRNGVVAVGDIANTTDTLDIRDIGTLHMHTFVEAIGFHDGFAAKAFDHACQTYNAFAAQSSDNSVLKQTVGPHAPYSVSPSLLRLISSHVSGSTISIHNQESMDENEYFASKSGAIPDLLHSLGIDDSDFKQSGKSSLQTYLEYISPDHPMIFVHNTFTTRQDVQYANSGLNDAYWCLCPNANLYIENRLPDIPMLIEEGLNICIGTDSLASNHQLSVLSELFSIKKAYPKLPWEQLIHWGTFAGACALKMQTQVGHLAVGLTPGIVQLTGLEDAEVAPRVNRIY